MATIIPTSVLSNQVDWIGSHHANDDANDFGNSRTGQILESRGFDAKAMYNADAEIPLSEADQKLADTAIEDDDAIEFGKQMGEWYLVNGIPENPSADDYSKDPAVRFYTASQMVHDYENGVGAYADQFEKRMLFGTDSFSRKVLEERRDKAAKTEKPDIARWGINKAAQIVWNTPTLIETAAKDHPPEIASAYKDMLALYDQHLPNGTKAGIKRAAKGILSDPITYATLGSTTLVKNLLKAATKDGTKKLLMKRFTDLMKGSSIIGGEVAAYSSAHDLMTQHVQAGGKPYDINWLRNAISTGMGFTLGTAATAAIPGVVKGAQAAAKLFKDTTQPNVLRSGIGPVPPAETAATDVSEIGFFSSVSRAIDNLPMDKGSSAQMRAMIAKSEGVKPEEMSWTGLDEFLKGRKNVTKAEIREFMDANQVRIKQVEKTSYRQTGEPENLTWGEAVADDSFEAYGHRVDDIEYELERGGDFYLEDIISQLMKDNPKKYPEIDPDGGSAWANKLRKHFEEGGTVSDLDDKMRYDVNDAIDGVAKAEYMDNPYVTVRDATGYYDIYGNDDVGYQIIRRSDGARVDSEFPGNEIYSLEEAKIQAYTDGLDYGYFGGQLDEGDTLFSEYTLPGGENYREVLLTLPSKTSVELRDDGKYWINNADGSSSAFGFNTREGAERLIRETNANTPKKSKYGEFRSGHFDEPNVLAHVRLNDRTGPNGEKILFVEEVQSDWHQKGRKRGYKDGPQFTGKLSAKEMDGGIGWEITDEKGVFVTNVLKTEGPGHIQFEPFANASGARSLEQTRIVTVDDALAVAQRRIDNPELGSTPRDDRVPDAPLKKNWHEMAMRRVIRMASEEGYDSIAWTPGQLQADRYDLSKHIDALRVEKIRDGEKAGQFLVAGRKGASTHSSFQRVVTEEELPNVIGKDLAAKVVKDAPKYPDGTEYTGLDLKVGGEGMRGFYDKIIKNYAEKFGKKFGAKVNAIRIGDQKSFRGEVWNLPITKKMRDSVMKKGVPLFGAGAIAAGTDKDNNQPAL